MKRPKPERKKHQLVGSEIDALFRIADLRDKAILALGLTGQDESTVSSLRIEQFGNKLSGEDLELVDLVRPKTNEDILLLLTPEVQDIVGTYLKTLKSDGGWLFPGYKGKHINPEQCNGVFQELCEAANIKDAERRLSFHCCRMWLSSQLRNVVSDDIIDLLTGHQTRFGGAYLGDTQQIRKSLVQAKVVDILRLQTPAKQDFSEKLHEDLRRKDEIISEVRNRLEAQSLTIQKLQTQIDMMMQGIVERDKRYFKQKNELETMLQELAKEDLLSMALKRGYILSKHKPKSK
jgi:hypothetical protein